MALHPTLGKRILRSIPTGTLRELNRLNSGEFFPVFLEVIHPNIIGVLRFVADNVDYVYGGNTYMGYPFKISLLNDADELPSAVLTIQNITKEIETAIKDSTTPATIAIFVSDSSSFNMTVKPRAEIGTANILWRADDLFLTQVEGNAVQISGRIVTWAYEQEPYPFIRATQDRTPALFR